MVDKTRTPTETHLPTLAMKGIQTLFGDVHEKKVVFCIDTSGSIYEMLPAIKEHLLETLLKMAYQESECYFNLVQFSSSVLQWSDEMVPCTPEIVAVAGKWIRQLEATTGTNTLDALLTAFGNNCDAVYLVSDGLPDQEPHVIFDHIAYIGKGRPVHCVYVSQGSADQRAWNFLEELGAETYGSFHAVSISKHGCVERVTPVHKSNFPAERIIRTNDGCVYPNLSNCSVTTALTGDPLQDPVFVAPNFVTNPNTGEPHPYYHPQNHWYWWGAPVPGAYGPFMYHPFYSWSRYRPSRAFIYGKQKLSDVKDQSNLCPTGSALLIGRRVLARHNTSGRYYSGTVKSQTYDHYFLVEFTVNKGDKFDESNFQETSVADIIAYDDAFRHPILPGDRAMVPANVDNPTRYCVVTVMEGSEQRAEKVPADDGPLTVAFSDGKTKSIPAGHAIWIPNGMYHRLLLEAKMPVQARNKLREKPGYPLVSMPGYPTKEELRSPDDYERVKPRFQEGSGVQVDHLLPPYYLPVNPTYDLFGLVGETGKSAIRMTEDEKVVNGTEMTVRDLSQKVDHQIQLHRHSKHASRVQDIIRESKILTDGSASAKDLLTDSAKSKLSDSEKDSGCSPDLSIDDIHDPQHERKPEEWSRTLSKELEDEDADYEPRPEEKSYISRRIRYKEPEATEIKPRPPWRHFSKDKIPDMLETGAHEPYEDCGAAASMETRPIRHIGGAVEWPGVAFNVAEPLARTRYDREALLEALGADPRARHCWQGRGPLGDVSRHIGAHEAPRQQLQLDRDAVRRQRVLGREEQRRARLDERRVEEVRAEVQRRDRHSAQLERLRQRQLQEEAAVARQREHKRAVVAALNARQGVEEAREAEQLRDVRRVEMIRQRREERDAAARGLDERVRANRQRLQELHRQRDAERWTSVHTRLQAEEQRTRVQDLVAREAERSRRTAHRQREEATQRQRDLEAYAARQNAPPLA